MLNVLWVGFFLVAFLIALFKLVILGDAEIFSRIVKALFDSSKTAFEIALGLTGVMTLWLGVMKIGERAGMLDLLTRGLAPLFKRLFPEVPANHPALGAMTMNMAANMLGLDNAATPLGIKAMKDLQTLNPTPDTASLGHAFTGDYLHLSRPARCGRPHRRFCATPDHYVYRHLGGFVRHQFLSADQFVEPRHVGLSRGRDRPDRRLSRLLQQPRRRDHDTTVGDCQ